MKSGGQVKDLPVHHRPPLVHEELLEPLGCSDRTTGSLKVPSPRSWSQLPEPSVMCGGTLYSRGGPTYKTKSTPNQHLDSMITSWSKLYWIHVNVHKKNYSKYHRNIFTYNIFTVRGELLDICSQFSLYYIVFINIFFLMCGDVHIYVYKKSKLCVKQLVSYLSGRTQGFGKNGSSVAISTVVKTGHSQLHKAVLRSNGYNV